MEANPSKSTISLEEKTRKDYRLMAPKLKRSCLSAESAMTGRPNIEDVPMGAKLPLIPGSKLQLYTTKLCKKLHLQSCDFDGTYPRDIYVSNEYRCLHDPHLKGFFVDRPEMRKRLRKKNFITPERKVICTLKEYNLYRQYLKHLSIEYWNKMYLEQYQREYEKNKEEIRRRITEKQEDPNNPIAKRNERAREARRAMEKACERRKSQILLQMQEYTVKREKEKREERLSRMVEEEMREKLREKAKHEKAAKEVEINVMREQLLTLKHKQDLRRGKVFEEKLKQGRKLREKVLVENYEKKRKFHHEKMLKLKRMLAVEETKRKIRVTEWETYFTRRHRVLFDNLDSLKEKHKRSQDASNKAFEERMKSRLKYLCWTDADRHNFRPMYFGFGDGGPQILRQLSAMGLHNVALDPDILKAIWNAQHEEHPERSSGDAAPVRQTLSQQAHQVCLDIVKQGYASEYVRHVIEVAQEQETKSRDIVARVIHVSRNVLMPLLEAYEIKTGVKIATKEIPAILHALSSGVFDEEEDYLPQIFSFDEIGRATMHAGSKSSNVRFIVSQSDIPMELKARKRPPTPKQSRLSPTSDSSSDSEFTSISSESHLILEGAIKQLTQRVVEQIFGSYDVVESELEKDEIHERINETAKSVFEEILQFGAEDVKAPSSSSASEDFAAGTVLEDKVSFLARQMLTDILADRKLSPKDGESQRSSSAGSVNSVGSILSVLALKVVTTILGSVDPETGKTLRQSVFTCDGLEERVANMSAKVVEEAIRERSWDPDEKIDNQGYAELKEKISKLALNIVTTATEGKRPDSSASFSSMCSADVEERVLDLSARIIGGIVKLKQLIPKHRKKNDDPLPHPVNSIERVLREIFNVDALQDAPNALQRATVRDVQRISDDIARRLVPPRNVSSAMSSGMSELVAVMTENAVINAARSDASGYESSMDNAVDDLAAAMVEETLADPKGARTKVFSSSESRLSSAISEIADAITQNALQRDTSESAINSAASMLAAALTAEAMDKVMNAQTTLERDTTESAISSGASNLASALTAEAINKTVNGAIMSTTVVEDMALPTHAVDSSTPSISSSGLKKLAERTAQHALDIAAANPEGLGSSTRSAISSGVSQLATHVASMLSGQESIPTSVLESLLSSAVSDLVSEMLTQQVQTQVSGKQDPVTLLPSLTSEIERMIQNIIETKGERDPFNATGETKFSHTISTLSAMESGVSDLASNIAKEILSGKGSKEHVFDTSASSAISAVAARYVHEVFGLPIKDDSGTVLQNGAVVETIVPTQVDSVAASPPLRASEDGPGVRFSVDQRPNTKEQHTPHPPTTDKPATKKVRYQLKGATTSSLPSINAKRQNTTNFSSSFSDWRTERICSNSPLAKERSPRSTKEPQGRSKSLDAATQLVEDFGGVQGTTASEEFNVVMDSLANRIVSSVFANREKEATGNDSQVNPVGSQSIERLVSSLALGIVTSLLGLDVLNGASSSEPSVADSEEDNAVNEERAEENAPGPSARPKNKGNAELDSLISQQDDDAESGKFKKLKQSPEAISIISPEDDATNWQKPSCELSCGDDNADEHPHRVRSPTRKDREENRRVKPRKLQGKGHTRSIYPRVSGWLSSKLPRKQSRPKSDNSSFETTPLKPSAGFLDRRWFTNSKNRRPRQDENVSSKPNQFSRRQATSPFSNAGHKTVASPYSYTML